MEDMVLRGLATNIDVWGQFVAEINTTLAREAPAGPPKVIQAHADESTLPQVEL
jgi:hypothetical protein